jgi:hypothetical protein
MTAIKSKPLRTAADVAMTDVFSRLQHRRSSPQANWYDASRWSPNRMWVWQPVQTARRDLDRYSRWEMNKRAEYLLKNSPIMRGLIRRMVTLTIGRGMFPTSKSKNQKWQEAVKNFWRNVARGLVWIP